MPKYKFDIYTHDISIFHDSPYLIEIEAENARSAYLIGMKMLGMIDLSIFDNIGNDKIRLLKKQKTRIIQNPEWPSIKNSIEEKKKRRIYYERRT